MPLDLATLFLPFGRPVTEELRLVTAVPGPWLGRPAPEWTGVLRAALPLADSLVAGVEFHPARDQTALRDPPPGGPSESAAPDRIPPMPGWISLQMMAQAIDSPAAPEFAASTWLRQVCGIAIPRYEGLPFRPRISGGPRVAAPETESPPASAAPVLAPASSPTGWRPAVEPHLSTLDAVGQDGGLPPVVKIGLPVLAIAAGMGYFLFSGADVTPRAQEAPSQQAIDVGGQGWVSEWASDSAGSRRGRQLTLYRPSMNLDDYRFEFTGTVETGAMGWVFRAADTRNYYGMKLAAGPAGLVYQRFAVVEGRESSMQEKPLAIAGGPGKPLSVRLDVRGPQFSVSVQGQPVDVWTDNRLRTGAVGFISEREERASTGSVQFSHYRGSR